MSDEVEHLRQRVNDLYHRLMKHVQRHGREERMCDHVTLRPPYLPCPHPDCFPEGHKRLFTEVARLPQMPIFYSASERPEDYPPMETNRETWEIVQLGAAKAPLWGWQRIR